MITQTTANVANLNQVNTNYRTGGAASSPTQGGGQQDSYVPSSDLGEQPVSYKQMLAASAGGSGGTQQAAAGGGGSKSKSITIGKDDYGVDASGNKIDPSKLAKSPVTSSNPDLQNQLNYLYSTKTGKAELDAIAKEHPGTNVVMGGPKGYKWGKGQGGVTIHDDKTGKDTIYINPAVANKSNPKENAGLIAHEGWHVLSPYKNTLAQEKTADDLRNSVTKELSGNYGDQWAKTKGFDSITWKDDGGQIYRDDYHEYDGMAKSRRPAVGDTSAEGAAVGSRNIPLDNGVVAQGDQIFGEESKGARTDEVLK
ncbi:MAG: hypothetical protein U0931_32975 [Vulcanimicrobiota bacterium]